MLANRGPQVIRRDWRPGFTIDLQQKDVRLVMEAAEKLGAPVVATSLIFNLDRTLQAEGLGAEGNHPQYSYSPFAVSSRSLAPERMSPASLEA